MQIIDAKSQRRNESQEGETRSRWRGVFIICVMLLILYPLSLGPFAYLQVRGFLPNDVADSATDTFYRPLWKYSRSETLLAKSYERYLQWWIQKALREQMRNLIQR